MSIHRCYFCSICGLGCTDGYLIIVEDWGDLDLACPECYPLLLKNFKLKEIRKANEIEIRILTKKEKED